MGFRSELGYVQGLVIFFVLVATASMFAVSTTTLEGRTILVGGSENWHYGFNYTNWAHQNAPFFVNDTLVFKFDPPSGIKVHNVNRLPNDLSYNNCDLSRAKLIANVTDGAGDGFKFVLKESCPYYFACSIGNGTHCNAGLMKFAVNPIIFET